MTQDRLRRMMAYGVEHGFVSREAAEAFLNPRWGRGAEPGGHEARQGFPQMPEEIFGVEAIPLADRIFAAGGPGKYQGLGADDGRFETLGYRDEGGPFGGQVLRVSNAGAGFGGRLRGALETLRDGAAQEDGYAAGPGTTSGRLPPQPRGLEPERSPQRAPRGPARPAAEAPLVPDTAANRGYRVGVAYGEKASPATRTSGLQADIQARTQKMHDWLAARPDEKFEYKTMVYLRDPSDLQKAGRWEQRTLVVTGKELADGIRNSRITVDDMALGYDYPADPRAPAPQSPKPYRANAVTTDLSNSGRLPLDAGRPRFWTSYNASNFRNPEIDPDILIAHELTRTTNAFLDPTIHPSWHQYEGQKAAGSITGKYNDPDPGIAQQLVRRMRENP